MSTLLILLMLQTVNNSAIDTDMYQTYEWVGYSAASPRVVDNGWSVYEANSVVRDLSFSDYNAFFESRKVMQREYTQRVSHALMTIEPDPPISTDTMQGILLGTTALINTVMVIQNDRLLRKAGLPRSIVITINLTPLLGGRQ